MKRTCARIRSHNPPVVFVLCGRGSFFEMSRLTVYRRDLLSTQIIG